MEFIENWGQEDSRGAGGRARTVFTLGVFDGLHLGHRLLIDTVIKAAGRLRAQSLVLTFDPHPLEILAKSAAPPVLTTCAQKAEILAEWGLDRLGILRFDKDMAALEPTRFLNQFVGKWTDPLLAVLGPDFSFGRNAAGNEKVMAKWLAENNPRAKVEVIEALSGAEGQFSSSHIRQALKNGLVEIAGRAMGRPYRLAGVVEHGAARGRQIGFPTANLGGFSQLAPAPGVYAVMALVGGAAYPAMTSIGANPTFGERRMTVETHIFDFHDFIYGREMSIDFAARLRDMTKFKSADELTAQLGQDKSAALGILKNFTGFRS